MHPKSVSQCKRRPIGFVLEGEFGIVHTTRQVDHVSDRDGLVELGRFG